ncbi:hypothetical protein Ddye_013261 [Dipteronia dyeriana]|uniref:Uncharacterized protein n=1 Tax=Dipteronia dyeriana TaxID=168575 RepID=A0AAD9X608_9ROSI|nr:hypothetical protein Ddye_013261 [Dipteronia dyeriana]
MTTRSPIENQSPMETQTSNQSLSRAITPIEFSSLSKCMNYSLPIKLGKDNHLYWKAQVKNLGDALMVVGEDINERDLVTSLVNGVGHEFDSIVAVISTQKFIYLEDAQYMLMMHEQRIKNLNAFNQPNVGQVSVNFDSNNFQEKKGQRDGGYQNSK